MSEQENELNIYQKIIEVKKQVSYIKKDKIVEVTTKAGKTFKYPAVTHDAVTAALREPLNDIGLVALFSTAKHEIHPQFTQVDVEVTLINTDNPDEKLTSVWTGYGQDFGDKAIGKAYSYAVKYFYLKTFQIETGTNEEDRPVEEDPEIQELASKICYMIDTNDEDGVGEAWEETTEEEKTKLWKAITKGGYFTQDQKTYIRDAQTVYFEKRDQNA